MEWKETYPPVRLDPSDARFWSYSNEFLLPARVHQESSLKYGAVKIANRIIAVREYDGRYWPVFKHWHGYLERTPEETGILKKVA